MPSGDKNALEATPVAEFEPDHADLDAVAPGHAHAVLGPERAVGVQCVVDVQCGNAARSRLWRMRQRMQQRARVEAAAEQ